MELCEGVPGSTCRTYTRAAGSADIDPLETNTSQFETPAGLTWRDV